MNDKVGKAKQARLPARLMAMSLAAMEFGQLMYVVPWAMWADEDGLLWLHPDYEPHARPQGTVAMKVELREDGYHVWPVRGYTYEPRSGHSYVGTPTQPFIPVAVLES